MTEFSQGPFLFSTGEKLGQDLIRWSLSYNGTELASRSVAANATRAQVADVFFGDIADFKNASREEFKPDEFRLVTGAGEVLASLSFCCWPDGMDGGIPDDRFSFWLTHGHRARPVSMSEFSEICRACLAPDNSWIASLLPGDTLAQDAGTWRAPTSWEIRHIVGEGSLTGITGAQAAQLVGVSPQNFRKYLAADSAKNRQKISFSAWHLLLQKLGVLA